ncbi:MAG TPA: sugar-binding protein [Prolixibacteraceae bacterium]|nr:sugar-binding protein [Prolixibacteraceae bacterium]
MIRIFTFLSLTLLLLSGFMFRSEAQIDLQIPISDAPPVIDGMKDALWNNGNGFPLNQYLAGSPVSESDLSAQFSTLWDTDNLYVLVDVRDDMKINDSQEVWQDDAVEVYIDINNDKLTSYGPTDYQYTFRWNDPVLHANGPSEGISFSLVGTSVGYLLEVAFPWHTLGLEEPASHVLLGLDIHTHDDDDGGERDNKKSWFATDDQSWNNPSLFATAQLTGELLILPRAEKPKISVDHGFYSAPFQTTLSSVLEGMTLYYTLDGSHPATSSTAIIVPSPAVVRIDPASEQKRGRTPAVILRACSKKEGYDFSLPETRTYIFIDEVKNQTTYPGHDWPNGNYVNDQEIDLLMDPVILNDSRYTNLIDDALLEIPSFSIATDNAHLFDPAAGIYVNAMIAHGEEWERPASIELIDPEGLKSFQIDAGLRIRGGWSRHGYFRKHAFRLFFREEYGESKLRFPLFDDEGVDEFDKVDLRCSQNYSWSKGEGEAPYCTFNRDVFSRDLQREMEQPYTRSRYYHLYLNGLYWGLFQTQERSEARYAESYFGDNSDDYDVVKRGDSGIEATDGNLDSWREIWELVEGGFASNDNYYKIQGRSFNGKRDPSLKVLVDIDNLIDYMNVIFYTGNFDAPVSAFGNNKSVNNFYAIDNRNNPNEGFRFFAHDNEHTLLIDPIGPGHGITENRVNIGSLNNNNRMLVQSFDQFHPQWLHFKLSENEEYRQRFSDRSYRYYHDNGILTPANTARLFRNRSLECDTAVIAESARWGDVDRWVRYTKDEHWKPMIERTLNEYFPYRTDIVIGQLENEGLLSSVAPPLFLVSGVPVGGENVRFSQGQILQIVNNSTNGNILYTLDGTDPRANGGNIATKAINGGNQVLIEILQTTPVKARIYNNGYWSSLRLLNAIIEQENDGIIVTEIHYNPTGIGEFPGSDYEFIEIKNAADEPRNLTAATFVDGIDYTFNQEILLEPGAFIVLAAKALSFFQRYGFEPYDEYQGQLNNGGERLTLVAPTGDTLFTVAYNDKEPWPYSPDGLGFSLVPAVDNPLADWDDGSNWRASSLMNGSPGQDDPANSIRPVIINELISNSDAPEVDRIELYNPNNSPVDIGGWYLSDKRDDPRKWMVPAATVIPAKGYITFDEGHYSGGSMAFNSGEFGSGFSLSSHGEDIYLFSGNGIELTGYEYSEDFGETETGTSLGRHTISTGKNHFVAQAFSSFNAENSYPRVGPVIINQIMYHPGADDFEYLELINTGSEIVDLFEPSGRIPWKVSGIDFDFPADISLNPGESVYLVESALSPDDFRFLKNIDPDVKIYNYAGKLKNEGEEITLYQSAPAYIDSNEVITPYIRIDRVEYNDKNPWPDADGNGNVLVRIGSDLYGNDPANWFALPPSISVSTSALANGIMGVPYRFVLKASGGNPAYSWSIASGTLAPGLSLDPVTGIFSGIPEQTGQFSFTVRVEDQKNTTSEKTLSLTIAENTSPIAQNDSSSTFSGYLVSCDVLSNDTDWDGDRFNWQISIVGEPTYGQVSINNDQTLTYAPAPGFTGIESIRYRASDVYGFSEASWIIEVSEQILSGEINIRVSQLSDDAEQNIITQQFWNTSSDLELAYDANPGGDQIVGIRFQNVLVPEGANITKAYIQFQTDETSSGTVSLVVSGENTGNPVTYSEANSIVSRRHTNTLVNWSPEAWTLEGESSVKQQTPELAGLIQEIIDRDDWREGNAMAFMISGSGTRTAEAYDGDPNGAPLLHIEYSNPYGEATLPVAIASTDNIPRRGEEVLLDGSTSYSADGRPLNYHWELISKPEGSEAMLSNPFAIRPSFMADLFGTYEIILEVDNSVYTSEPYRLNLSVENHAPVARAGSDQIRYLGSTIRLNGSASFDDDNDAIHYTWNLVQKPAGSVALLSNPNLVNPTFIADREGIYHVELTVSDGFTTSSPDEVIITITANLPPQAHAGDDMQVAAGDLVLLDGTNSVDPEGNTLSFSWSVFSSPEGSNASLSNANTSRPVLRTDLPGAYCIVLLVSDGVNQSLPDTLCMQASENRKPVALAGSDRTVNAGDRVRLSGNSSYDPDGSSLSFFWSLVTRPSGSNARIENVTSVNPYFYPDVSGVYAIRLQVSDGTLNDTDELQITALRTNAAPEFMLQRTLLVYPNPFHDVLTADFRIEGEQQVTFGLYTLTGEKIHEEAAFLEGHVRYALDHSESGLPNGLYLLSITPEKGVPALVKVHYIRK